MMLDDAIDIIVPEPDKHFRLLPCKCGSDNVAYVLSADRIWRVHCFDCGHDGAGSEIRHEAQVAWNKEAQ